MIMENKTTELQNKKNTAAIFSDIRQQVEEGRGFLSVCLKIENKKRDLPPASRLICWNSRETFRTKTDKEEYGKKKGVFTGKTHPVI